MKISAVILTRNEEKNIERCINSLSFCDEVVVVDDNSVDQTRVLAEQAGAVVYTRSLNGDFSAQRNFGLSKAKGEWVFFVDADETVTEELKDEILAKTENSSYDGCLLPRRDIFFGKELKHGEAGRVKIVRLAEANAGKWERAVHEHWRVKGKVGKLNNPLMHRPHQRLDEYAADVDFYSTLHAKANYREGKRSGLLKIVFFPCSKFLRNYVLRLGFLDGVFGMVHALFMSFHSFLSWSKLYIWQKNPDLYNL